MVSSVLMTLRKTVQLPFLNGMGILFPFEFFCWLNMTSERKTLIFPASISLIRAS